MNKKRPAAKQSPRAIKPLQRLQVAAQATTALKSRGGRPPSVHVWDDQSIHAINAALDAGRPLLVRGEPGTGKSQLARAAAAELKRVPLMRVIDAHTESTDLRYEYDAVQRLAHAQLLGAALGTAEGDLEVRIARLEKDLALGRFINPAHLWWALDWDGAKNHFEKHKRTPRPPAFDPELNPLDGVVLLLDEMDKAESSVPNGLLEVLDERGFDAPGCERVQAKASAVPPLVIVTTNDERELPGPFLRRCIVMHLELPTIDVLVERGDYQYGEKAKALLHEWNQSNAQGIRLHPVHSDAIRKAAELLFEDRRLATAEGVYAPGQAEFMDLLRMVARIPTHAKQQTAHIEAVARFTFEKAHRRPRSTDSTP